MSVAKTSLGRGPDRLVLWIFRHASEVRLRAAKGLTYVNRKLTSGAGLKSGLVNGEN